MAEENTITAGKQAARSKMARRSLVWEHFARFTDGDGKDKAECKRCRLVLGADTRSGTSTLRNHVKICKGRDVVPVSQSHPTSPSSSLPLTTMQLQLSSGPGESSSCEPHQVVQLDEAAAREDLARMIALHGYDPSVVEDDHFRSFLRRLHPEFKLPSREAIEKVCHDVFTKSRTTLLDCSKVAPGSTNYGLGTATSIEAGKEVMYVTCHYIDHQWNLHRVVVDAYEILPPGGHYHVPLLGARVVSSLHHAVERIVSYITFIYLHYKKPFMIAEEITADFVRKMKGCIQRNWRSAYPSVNRKLISATYMDHVLHSVARRLLPDSDFAEGIFKVLEDMELTKQEFQVLLSQLGLDDPRDYDLHWYSCYCSLEILGQQIPDTESEPEDILLRSLWRDIYCAIKRVTASTSPTSNLCLEDLCKVRYALQSRLSSLQSRLPSNPDEAYSGMYLCFGNKNVVDVLQEALQTVDEAIQDSYLVWSIPLVLDPRYKLFYVTFNFQFAFGSDAANYYTSKVARKIKELYRSYIEDDDGDSDGCKDPHDVFFRTIDVDDDSDDNVDVVVIDSPNNRSEQARDEHCPTQQDYVGAQADELDWYLQDSLVRRTEDFDILNWWKVHGSAQYPTVARMARYALAMPTCSKLTSDQTAHVRSIIRGYC